VVTRLIALKHARRSTINTAKSCTHLLQLPAAVVEPVDRADDGIARIGGAADDLAQRAGQRAAGLRRRGEEKDGGHLRGEQKPAGA
jgi:hypothetical protein